MSRDCSPRDDTQDPPVVGTKREEKIKIDSTFFWGGLKHTKMVATRTTNSCELMNYATTLDYIVAELTTTTTTTMAARERSTIVRCS